MTHVPSSSKFLLQEGARVSYFLLQPSCHDALEQLRGALEVSLVRQSALQKVWTKALARSS